jgi:hypothetical protein
LHRLPACLAHRSHVDYNPLLLFISRAAAAMQQVQVPVCTKATTPKPVGCKPGYKRVSGKCYQCSAGTYSPDGKTCRWPLSCWNVLYQVFLAGRTAYARLPWQAAQQLAFLLHGGSITSWQQPLGSQLTQPLHVLGCRLCPKDTYAAQRGAARCTPCASSASSQFFVNDDGQKCFRPRSNAARTGCGRCFDAHHAAAAIVIAHAQPC